MERCERELEQERKMRSVLESNIKKIAKSDQVVVITQISVFII
jgi:hypothetical protein